MAVSGSLVRRILAVALAIALLVGLAPSGAVALTRPHYDLQVSLAFHAATLEVVQKTTFRNNTGADLPDLVFQVVPAYFGAFTLRSASVGGREVPATREGTVLELKLDTPIPRDGRADVELRYRIQPPPSGGRFGRGEGILALGNWFPVLAVHQEGWDRHQYVDVGDAFFTEAADFDVVVTSDVPVAIGASGSWLGPDAVRQTFHAEGVRDFAMAISDRYQVRTREVDGVLVTALGLNLRRLEGYLDTAEKTLRWLSEKLAPYPYPTLDIAETRAAQFVPTLQENPGLIFLYSSVGDDGGGPGSYSEYILAHEVIHQWFYSLVGNDQVHDPWLDEALTTYVDHLYYRDRHPALAPSLWQQRVVAGYRNRVAAGGDRPVDTTVYDYRDDVPYFDVVYRKGAIFLEELRELMGDGPFMELLRDYVATHREKVAVPRAFLDMACVRGGPRVPPLVARYFSYGAFSGGAGYGLEVEWPRQLRVAGTATLSYRAGFPVSRAKVWLDNRLLHSGAGDGPISLSLEGVEEGEYVLRLDLLDAEGALYQRAVRVKVE